jgi:hypothetical protein
MLARASAFLAALGLVALPATACSKSVEATPATMASATATPSAGSAASSAAASASAAGAPSATPPAGASASPSATPSGAPPELAAANAACGNKPLPDCPLQAWMKTNTNPALAKNDLPTLAVALDKMVAFGPPGYVNWASISKDGAKAARAGDVAATKASCRTCHEEYKTKYHADLRGRKL